MIPFTRDVLFSVVEQYNAAIWPAHIIAYALGAVLVLLTLRPRRGSGRIVSAVLAAAWLWVGVIYHMMFFAAINWAAWAFAAIFVVQAFLFAWTGGVRERLAFRFTPTLYGLIGLAFLVLSMVVYPLVGLATDRSWPETATVGLAPGPVVIFTFGMLLLTTARVPLHVMVVPLLWSLIGGAVAWQLDVFEDLLVPAVGASGFCLVLRKNSRPRPASTA